MTPADDHDDGLSGDDALAAEYVLGGLTADERQAAARRIDTDAAFAGLVEDWEVRLSPMADGYAEVAPPAAAKAAIDRRLDAAPAGAGRAGLWHSLVFWRGLAAAAVALLVFYAAITELAPPAQQNGGAQLVASLADAGTDVRYVAVYDPAHHRVGLSHLSGARAADHDFELWVIDGGNPPVSLGVIPVGNTVHVVLPQALYDKLRRGAVLAISLEPAGGSPTGRPTGPVVATGEARQL